MREYIPSPEFSEEPLGRFYTTALPELVRLLPKRYSIPYWLVEEAANEALARFTTWCREDRSRMENPAAHAGYLWQIARHYIFDETGRGKDNYGRDRIAYSLDATSPGDDGNKPHFPPPKSNTPTPERIASNSEFRRQVVQYIAENPPPFSLTDLSDSEVIETIFENAMSRKHDVDGSRQRARALGTSVEVYRVRLHRWKVGFMNHFKKQWGQAFP